MLWLCLALGVLALTGIDQLTKWLAVTYLQGQPIVLIDGVLELRYSENDGAAWGMFSGARWPLIVFTILLMALVVGLLLSRRFRSYKLAGIAGCLILAGGLGNLIDRVFRGFVVDFVYVRLIDFPIFNVADCCVVIGAALMLIFLMFVYRESPPPVAEEGEDAGEPIPQKGEEQQADETGNMDGPSGTDGPEA